MWWSSRYFRLDPCDRFGGHIPPDRNGRCWCYSQLRQYLSHNTIRWLVYQVIDTTRLQGGMKMKNVEYLWCIRTSSVSYADVPTQLLLCPHFQTLVRRFQRERNDQQVQRDWYIVQNQNFSQAKITIINDVHNHSHNLRAATRLFRIPRRNSLKAISCWLCIRSTWMLVA